LGTYGGIGIVYLSLSLIGARLNYQAYGLPALQAIPQLELASRLWPFERNIAVAPAYYALNHWTIPGDYSERMVLNGLSYDPNSADLLIGYAEVLESLNRSPEAEPYWTRALALSPRGAFERRRKHIWQGGN
jgi:hypothetical protein